MWKLHLLLRNETDLFLKEKKVYNKKQCVCNYEWVNMSVVFQHIQSAPRIVAFDPLHGSNVISQLILFPSNLANASITNYQKYANKKNRFK